MIIGFIAYLTYIEYTTGVQNQGDSPIGMILAVLGFAKLILFDAPMFVLFIREHWSMQDNQANNETKWEKLSNRERRISVILYSMIFLSLGVYLERIIANDILFKL